jgi:hypothetical protein
MKIKRFFLALLFTWLFAVFASAQYVEIGTGTSVANYVPLHGFWDFGWSQVIYLQSEIGEGFAVGGIS